MIVKLKGITNHGKNRIREHGEIWKVIEPNLTPKPIMLLVESVQTGDRRWVNHNFEVIT